MSGKATNSQTASDLDRARERLSFYEQFDEIIKQNIASSSALLKEASARVDSDFADERRHFRALLANILDDVTALQAQSEHLARRVNDALDELENKLPAGSEAPATTIAPVIATEAPPEAAAVIDGATRKKREDSEPPAEGSLEALPTEPAPSPSILPKVAPVAELPPSDPVTMILLVHGVPKAGAALKLKSYIETLDFVTAVEPREFAAGLLRLQISGARPLTVDDLAGWEMASQIQLKTASDELLEFGLTPA